MAKNEYEKAVAQFAVVLFHSATTTHLMHLQAKGKGSYAKHKALQKYYENIVDLVDNYVEAYQGCYNLIETYPQNYHGAVEAESYLKKLKDYVTAAKKTLPDEPNLVNTYADILDLLDSTIYKLKYLE